MHRYDLISYLLGELIKAQAEGDTLRKWDIADDLKALECPQYLIDQWFYTHTCVEDPDPAITS